MVIWLYLQYMIKLWPCHHQNLLVVNSRIHQTPVRGKSATVKVIQRPRISKKKRNQGSCMPVCAPRVNMMSVKDYAEHISNEG